MINALKKALIIAAICLAGCADLQQKQVDLPVRWGTIVEASPSYRAGVKEGSAGATLAGGAIGGALGHQVGKGNGKKVATGLGVILGAATANAASEKQIMVPTTAVVITDDASNEAYQVMLDGNWRRGMKVRFSVQQGENGDYQVIIR